MIGANLPMLRPLSLARFSVAARLAAVGGCIVALAIALTALSVVRQVDQAMTDRIKSRLDVNLRVARDELRAQGGDGLVHLEDGRLVAANGRVLDGDVDLVDRIRDVAEGTATVFRGDLRVATNVRRPDGTRATGTHLAPGPVYDTVLRDGRTYRGEADVLGTTYLTAYEPLKDKAGTVVGILYVGIRKAEYFAVVENIRRSALWCGLAMAVVGAGAIFLAVRRAFRPFDALRETMAALAAGRLDTTVPGLDRVDEIGRMAKAVQVFQQTAVAFAKTKAAELSDAHRAAQIGIWRYDLLHDTLIVSDEAHSVLGTDPSRFPSTMAALLGVVHPDDRAELAGAIDRARTTGDAVRQTTRVGHHDGQCAWIRFEAWPEIDPAGHPVAIRGVCQDVTDQRMAADRIQWLAHHDPLTSLANRALLNDRLLGAIARASHTGRQLGVLCLDLDGFKAINDVHGHAAGDAVLREVAARLACNIRDSDTVARLGGDEFVVLHDAAAPVDHARALAERLLAVLAEPYDLGNGQVGRVTVSVGIATFPADGQDPEALLQNADTALSRAKADGKNAVVDFRIEMDAEIRDCRVLEHDLRSALERNEFTLDWQPLCTASDAMVMSGFEVLLRWRHPTRGLVSPEIFIPIAEATGAIVEIGAWVLREACVEAASWTQPLVVSVNVSPIQAQQGEVFANLVQSILADTGLAPDRLMLEVTEGVLIREPDRVMAALRPLKALGVRVALDDFGTGYSSLATLRAFPFDKIKIDRAFITGVADNGPDAAIVRAVLGLASGLGLPVIAEGVETMSQLAALRAAGCQQVQGWLAGRPAPIARFAQFTRGEVASAA